jgi:hypothetical protein
VIQVAVIFSLEKVAFSETPVFAPQNW